MGKQGLTHDLGGDPSVRERSLKLGIGLGLGVDQTMDVLFEFRAEFFGLFAAAKFINVQAENARAEFVEPGVDRGPSPAKSFSAWRADPLQYLRGIST